MGDMKTGHLVHVSSHRSCFRQKPLLSLEHAVFLKQDSSGEQGLHCARDLLNNARRLLMLGSSSLLSSLSVTQLAPACTDTHANSKKPAALRVRKLFWEETDLTVRAPNLPESHQDSLTFLLFTVLYLEFQWKEFFSEQLHASLRGMWILQFTSKG